MTRYKKDTQWIYNSNIKRGSLSDELCSYYDYQNIYDLLETKCFSLTVTSKEYGAGSVEKLLLMHLQQIKKYKNFDRNDSLFIHKIHSLSQNSCKISANIIPKNKISANITTKKINISLISYILSSLTVLDKKCPISEQF